MNNYLIVYLHIHHGAWHFANCVCDSDNPMTVEEFYKIRKIIAEKERVLEHEIVILNWKEFSCE